MSSGFAAEIELDIEVDITVLDVQEVAQLAASAGLMANDIIK